MSKRVYRPDSVTSRHATSQRPHRVANSVVAPYDSSQNLPDSARAMRHRVQRALQQRDYPSAIAILNQLIGRPGAQAADFNNRGLVHLWHGQLPQAIRDFDQALVLNPELPAAYNNRANYYAALGDWASALADYDHTIDLNPFHVQARINRGVALRELACYDAALESFDDALLFNQLVDEAYAERGRTYHLRGDWNGAIADYRRALQEWSDTDEEMLLASGSCRYRVMMWLSEFGVAA